MKSVSLLLIALTLIALPVAAQTKGNAGDQEAIKSIALKWQDCWNRHDWKALTALVAEMLTSLLSQATGGRIERV